ncbi:MAG: long-chain fatty acid--CoA ligase [Gemmatimonadales bacterium]|nr:MAG: long-chain fatty acid--CoA ligase [Gemmatimonadales bacterium]
MRAFLDRVERSGPATALETFPEGRRITWTHWEELSRRFAARLMAQGVGPGDRVAIWAGNRPLWPVADLGALMAGAVPVGIYPSSAPAQVERLLADAGAVVAVADLPGRVALLAELARRLPDLRVVMPEEAVDPGAAEDTGGAWAPNGGHPVPGHLPGAMADPDQDALLIYTSGSTGEAKGARISHRTLMASAASIREALGLREGDRTLSFLPYCHAAERIFGLYTRILAGMETILVEDHRRVWDAAGATHPTLFGGLPRFFEKLETTLRVRGEAGGDPLRALRELMGERVRLVTSGGATLQEHVSAGLARWGIVVLGAYGLTEHLCAAMNRPDRLDPATSGPPMPGTDLCIADDGEILLRRGPLTFSGYLGRDEETRAAFTPDGEWLRTGDLGAVDERGFLRITGRKKELIALSTGKKVAPVPLEHRLSAHPWIAQAMLVGEGEPFVGALIVPDRDAVEAWARRQEVRLRWRDVEGPVVWPGILDEPDVQERIVEAVRSVNREVSRTERVRRLVLLHQPFTTESDELTPTLKLRRGRVVETRADAVTALHHPDHPRAAAWRGRAVEVEG